MSTHEDICLRAVRWLHSYFHCNIALHGIASTTEIPDAIGWSTSRPHQGSVVVECKRSRSDFHADKRKLHQRRMGDFRYFLTTDQLVTSELVAEHYPLHGLAYVQGSRIKVVRVAERRCSSNLHGEIRLLQFALLHMKDNLLRAGFSVDMNELTKHPWSADRSGLSREVRL